MEESHQLCFSINIYMCLTAPSSCFLLLLLLFTRNPPIHSTHPSIYLSPPVKNVNKIYIWEKQRINLKRCVNCFAIVLGFPNTDLQISSVNTCGNLKIVMRNIWLLLRNIVEHAKSYSPDSVICNRWHSEFAEHSWKTVVFFCFCFCFVF